MLTWSALRYTAHSHCDDVGPQMLPYDEAVAHRDGNVKGSGKELMIQKLLQATFHPPALHKLINELRGWFCERYRTLEPNVEIPLEESTGAKIAITDNLDATEARHPARQCGDVTR